MSIMEIVGRFHPLLVHLPIGILVLAIAFEWLSGYQRYQILKPAITTIISLGAITALFSCITGYLLSQNGEYDGDTVSWHQWLGISVTLLSFLYVWIRSKSELAAKVFSVVVLVLLSITGHLGGSLTHGEDYLTEGLFTNNESMNVASIDDQTKMYADLVQPILESKCYTCHNASKQKGKLRLDAPEHIQKGGKNGTVLVAHKVDESEMIDRLLLPLDQDEHMPPKEKKQLSSVEVEILKRWIASGASFDQTVGELKLTNNLKDILQSHNTPNVSEVPIDDVGKADESIINKLRMLEVMVVPVSQESRYLSVNLINTTNIDSALVMMQELKEQIVWLNASSTSISDVNLKLVGALTNLSRLHLNNTKLSGEGLVSLKPLINLRYLNLSNTNVTGKALMSLASLTSLTSLHVYNTAVQESEIDAIQKAFLNARIEWKNYVVPMLPTDTVRVMLPYR
ncbi:MAG: hypothetical protein LW863_07510 [Flammeovirgaceae bacterium]|nr:hypothetical protein [Flammeovirgaceae bacterium]